MVVYAWRLTAFLQAMSTQAWKPSSCQTGKDLLFCNPYSMKKMAILLLQSLFGLILLAFFFKNIDTAKTVSYFSFISLPLTLLAVAFYTSSIFIRIWRFKLLLAPLKKISFFDSVTASFAGAFLNYMIPLRVGEVGRAWFIKKKYNFSLVSGTTVSFIDKTFDLFAILILLAAGFMFLNHSSMFSLISLWQIVLVASVICAFYLSVKKEELLILIFSKIFFFLPKPILNKLLVLLKRFFEAFKVLKISPPALIFLLSISIMALILDGIYFYSLFLVLGVKSSFLLVIFGYSIYFLSFMVPAGPFYIGNFEFLGFLIFSKFLGIPSDQVSSVVILHHFLITFIISLPGFISLVFLHFNWLAIFRQNKG